MLELSILTLVGCCYRSLGVCWLRKTLLNDLRVFQVYACSMLPPITQGARLNKKGFCEDNLTKQAQFGQERLTGFGQETLTNLFFM